MKQEINYQTCSEDDVFMAQAKHQALTYATDRQVPVGAVLVRGDEVLFRAANTGIKNEFLNKIHGKGFCLRRFLKIKSGYRYDLCPLCVNPTNHPEQQCLRWAKCKSIELSQCVLYLWGHHTCCPSCTNVILSTELRTVFTVECAHEKFRK